MSEGAFLRVLTRELDAALEDSWYDLLRWMRRETYGAPVDKVALRSEARERATRGEIPPWPDADA